VRLRTAIGAFFLFTGFSLAAEATPITFGSSGLSSPDTLLDFEDPALFVGETITTQFSASGVTFSADVPTAHWEFKTFGASTFDGITSGHVFRSGTAEFSVMSIDFTAPVSDTLFNFKAAGSVDWTMTSLLGGSTVETVGFTSINNNPNSYFGFTSSNFDEIQIANVTSFAGFELDHLQFNIPEPSSFALVALGLTGLGIGGSRRSADRKSKRVFVSENPRL
jgi:hypothetical protein